VTALDPTLLAWLTRPDHEPIAGWAPEPPLDDLRCHPDLIARVAEVARPVRGTARTFVAGCPVIHHSAGRPIAAAAGTRWFAVRSAEPAGALRVAEPRADLGAEWVELDPWASDMSFAKALDLLRRHVSVAFSLAEGGDR
jgi:hypothetical protein